jgi:hypothetical protein
MDVTRKAAPGPADTLRMEFWKWVLQIRERPADVLAEVPTGHQTGITCACGFGPGARQIRLEREVE